MVFPAKSRRFIAPGLRYRQHAVDLIGADGGFIAKFGRFDLMLSGRLQQWNVRNIEALLNLCEKLTPENRSIYDEFSRFRNVSL